MNIKTLQIRIVLTLFTTICVWLMYCDSPYNTKPRVNAYDPELPGNLSIYDPIRLTDEVNARQPSLSPDGTKIVFQIGERAEERIWVMNIDGSDKEQLPLISNHEYEFDPKWSPNDNRIAFSNGPDWNIFLRTYNDSTFVQLTNEKNYRHPVWNPTGEKIACINVLFNKVWIIDLETGQKIEVYKDPFLLYLCDWSETNELLFISSTTDTSLRILNVETKKVKPVPIKEQVVYGKWLPERSHIIYTCFKNNRYELWKSNNDGSDSSVVITENRYPELIQVIYPFFSNNSSTLVFEASLIRPNNIFNIGRIANIYITTISDL